MQIASLVQPQPGHRSVEGGQNEIAVDLFQSYAPKEKPP
jgi:hypothetical protein